MKTDSYIDSNKVGKRTLNNKDSRSFIFANYPDIIYCFSEKKISTQLK